MNLDITFDTDAEEIVMTADDHQTLKFAWDSHNEVTPGDKRTKVFQDEDDSGLYDTLVVIARRWFIFNGCK